MADLPDDFVGVDRIVLNDVSRFGLHRLHVVRTGEWPDLVYWENKVPVAVFERKTWTMYRIENEFHLYITWPEPEPEEEYWKK